MVDWCMCLRQRMPLDDLHAQAENEKDEAHKRKHAQQDDDQRPIPEWSGWRTLENERL